MTIPMKVIIPPIWIGLFVVGTILLFVAGDQFKDQYGNSPDPIVKWVVFLATILGSAAMYKWGIMLKRVRMDSDALYISNYLREITVPLRNVERVTENYWLVNPHHVTIQFNFETDFGSQVVFMPKVKWRAFLSSHPIVAELQVASVRSRDTSPQAPAA